MLAIGLVMAGVDAGVGTGVVERTFTGLGIST